MTLQEIKFYLSLKNKENVSISSSILPERNQLQSMELNATANVSSPSGVFT